MKKVVFVLCSILLLVFVMIPAHADSGWDTDYDSGSSWDSDSSWDSGSSWDDDSSWNSGSSSSGLHHGGSGRDPSIGGVMGLAIASILIVVIILNWSNRQPASMYDKGMPYVEVDNALLREYGINDISKLKQEVFDKFVKIQEAWMNFDYSALQNLCTDESYNTYKAQLETLKLKNGQNIMSDFKLIDSKVTFIRTQGNNIELTVYMDVSFYDYVIDMGTKTVIRGNNRSKVTNRYMMIFVKSAVNTDDFVTCPNCGNQVHIIVSGQCEYCRTFIVRDSDEFVLSEKKIIK